MSGIDYGTDWVAKCYVCGPAAGDSFERAGIEDCKTFCEVGANGGRDLGKLAGVDGYPFLDWRYGGFHASEGYGFGVLKRACYLRVVRVKVPERDE